jgi:hypothetical protein
VAILIFGSDRFCELKMLKLGRYVFIIIVIVYEDSRLHILQVRQVSLVTVIFGNPEVYAIDYVCSSTHVFRRMERTLYFEKGNCIV